MNCYLDNAATTRTLPEAAELAARVMTEDFGNPSSLHGMGFQAETYVREAARQIAQTLRVGEKNIVFTSGGTESNNTALIGSALANQRQGKHIITTAFEHPSVTEPLLWLEKQGFEITFLPVGADGRVAPESLEQTLREDTILVSIMWVNNEIGAVQDIAALAKIVKSYNPSIVFHTDAIQAYGKLPLRPAKAGVDCMSVSGHKLHGPKGTGFLYLADGVKTNAYIHGGGQQKNRRSGTENVPGIAALGLAAEAAARDLDANYERVSGLTAAFIQQLSELEGVEIHGRGKTDTGVFSPYIISVGVQGVKAEVLLHALEERDIYVSSGSACSSNHPGISDTLTAIGVDKTFLDSTIRFSLSRFTTQEELNQTMSVFSELIPMLRRFTKR